MISTLSDEYILYVLDFSENYVTIATYVYIYIALPDWNS